MKYITYQDFVDKKARTLALREIDKEQQERGVPKRIIGRIDCPIEATITLNKETLDSRLSPCSAIFGSMERVGQSIIFDLEYNENYLLQIIGTDQGTMDLTIEYQDEKQNTINRRRFEKIPIVKNGEINTSAFDVNGTFVLYQDLEGTEEKIWSAGINGIANTSDKSLSSKYSVPDDVDNFDITIPPINTIDTGNPTGLFNTHHKNTILIVNSEILNGKIVANLELAAKGTTVTLTATPDEGYNLSSLTVTDSKGNELELTDKGDSKYTFVMPASAVTVNAVFEKVEPAESTPIDETHLFPFTDVLRTDWFCNAVEYVFTNDLMSGTAPYTFDPQGKMNRAMVWTVLGRMADADVDGSESPWYSKVQAWAMSNNVSDGTNPTNSISRQELMTMLWRYIGSPAATADLSKFSDSESVADWAGDAMQWAVSTGLIVGDNGRLNPTGDARRCEVAIIFMRYCENSAE